MHFFDTLDRNMTAQASWQNIVLDSAAAVALTMMAISIYGASFLSVPILTEVRDFLFNYGWGARLQDVLIPTGSDARPLSWSFFAWQQRLFKFNAEAVNLVQFVLLGLGAVVAYIHVRQLLGKRTAAFGASALWLLSYPATHAAFWQATQHDKLAFIFALLALIVSFYAIRLDRLKLVPIFAVLILALVVAAIATKPVSFMLPGALVVQAVLFTPQKNRSGYLRAGALIVIPTVCAMLYAVVYLLKMDTEWKAHAVGGEITRNVLVYIRSVTNSDYDGSLVFAVPLFALVGIGWLGALWLWGTRVFAGMRFPVDPRSNASIRHEDVLIYLCAIFVGSIAILARARYPVAFYVLLPMFAFTSSLAALALLFFGNGRAWVRRGGVVLVSVVAIGLLLNCWANVTGQSRLGQWRRSAQNLAYGYEILRNRVDPKNVDSLIFFFRSEPEGYFYFFSDGSHQFIDPLIPSFIFRRQFGAPIQERIGEVPTTASPGELIAVWSHDLQLVNASVSGTNVYHNAVVPVK